MQSMENGDEGLLSSLDDHVWGSCSHSTGVEKRNGIGNQQSSMHLLYFLFAACIVLQRCDRVRASCESSLLLLPTGGLL